MDNIKLNISNLILSMGLSRLEPRLRRELAEIFDSFIEHNGLEPDEVMHIFPIRTRRWKRIKSEQTAFIRESLKLPLTKFPFTENLQRDTDQLQKKLGPFAVDGQFEAFLEGVRDPQEVVFCYLNRGWLVRKSTPRESALFLNTGSRRRLKAASVFGATYFNASLAMPVHDGLMLHGAGIGRHGSGLLFLGLSGGGKTTVARFSPPDEVLSDDGIIVERSGANHYLSPTPFDQNYSTANRDKRKLNMGLFLKKDNNVFLHKVTPPDACSRILKNSIHYFRYYPQEIAEKSFNLVNELCRQIPFYILHFKKDPSFWDVLDEELSHIS